MYVYNYVIECLHHLHIRQGTCNSTGSLGRKPNGHGEEGGIRFKAGGKQGDSSGGIEAGTTEGTAYQAD